MKVTLLGNCQMKALTWYIQQLNLNFDVKYVWTDIGFERFQGQCAKEDTFGSRTIPTIVDTQLAKERLSNSNYILYNPIQPSRVKHFNYEDIKQYGANSKLIPIGCFYLNRESPSSGNLKMRGLMKTKERSEKHNMDIHIHKIIMKYRVDQMATHNKYHPKVLYFLELVREICTLTGWNYYSDEQYNEYSRQRFPFG